MRKTLHPVKNELAETCLAGGQMLVVVYQSVSKYIIRFGSSNELSKYIFIFRNRGVTF
jgi:hypothetical protein